jgi:hypothetical protein
LVNAAERLATLPLLPADPSELIAICAGLVMATLMPAAALAPGCRDAKRSCLAGVAVESKPFACAR